MSVTRLRWLLAVVVVELLIIISLIIWVMAQPDSESTTDTQTNVATDNSVLSASLLATGFEAPTNIVTVPDEADERLFITERNGAIKAIHKQGGGETITFLDITSKVKDNGSEMGLLGLTFHPKFAENTFFYVNYTDKEDNTIIARYQTKADGTADAATEKILIKVKQPYENHNGGALAFGPDGFLYIALGDGGSGGDPQNYAQSKNTLLGKILRIDVDGGDSYVIPTTNPPVPGMDGNSEIWAYGLRNPWRISFDRETGDLYIADVGQNKIEEVNFQKATSKGGENYGWRCYEGTTTFNTENCKDANTYVMPAFQYEQGDGRKAVVGGYVYRGQQMTSLTGAYLFGDTYSGEIIEARQAADGSWNQKMLLKTPYTISTFGQDQDGELYIADLQSGSIYKLQTN